MKFTKIFFVLFVVFSALAFSYLHALGSLSNPGKVCTGTWSFPPIYVGGPDGVVYAENAYGFDENCQPVLIESIRLKYLPEWVIHPAPHLDSITVKQTVPPPPPSPDTKDISFLDNSLLNVNTCHVKTWEHDVLYLEMMGVQDDLTYSWNNSTVTISLGSVQAYKNFSWWYFNGSPTATSGYNNPQVAWAKGSQEFYCQGGPFCGSTPSYGITLYTNMTIDYQGGCGGYGTYAGSVVPAGQVRYSYWRD